MPCFCYNMPSCREAFQSLNNCIASCSGTRIRNTLSAPAAPILWRLSPDNSIRRERISSHRRMSACKSTSARCGRQISSTWPWSTSRPSSPFLEVGGPSSSFCPPLSWRVPVLFASETWWHAALAEFPPKWPFSFRQNLARCGRSHPGKETEYFWLQMERLSNEDFRKKWNCAKEFKKYKW